jgi:hypothetical protein
VGRQWRVRGNCGNLSGLVFEGAWYHQYFYQSQKIKIKIKIIRRAPRPYGASPTQPYKCSQNVKVKVKTAHAAVGAENFGLRRDKQVQPLHHPHQRGFDF